jgi:hypothetical protein
MAEPIRGDGCQMTTIRQLDPLDIRAVMDALAKTSSFRVLVLMPSGDKRRRFSGALWAYTTTGPDIELEHDVKDRGGVLVGYYTKKAVPAAVMADIAAAMEAL